MSSRSRVVCALLTVCGLWAAGSGHADPLTTERPRRRLVNRFAGTWSLGASVGAGSPLGLAGFFIEARPIRALSLGVGGGFGGSFGPSISAATYLSPYSTRVWSPQIGVSISHNIAWVSGEVIPDHAALPGSTDWVGVEIANEFRPSRSMLIRIGIGRAFLLSTSRFGVVSSAEVSNLPEDPAPVPGVTPFDAVRAAAAGDTLGVWFIHLDIAPTWRF